MCEVHDIFGFQRKVADRGISERMLIPPTARVHATPKTVKLENAAIIEPLACAGYRLTGRSPGRPGSRG